MFKSIAKIAAFALALCLAAPGAAAAGAGEEEIMVRVGLASSYYHNALGELEAAHLENEDGYGEGYRFGYYDEDLNFVELARTGPETTQVAVLKTENLTYGYSSALSKYTYGENLSGDTVVGCYHVLVADGVSREEAEQLAGLFEDGFVAWIDGRYQVRAGAYQTEEEAEDALADISYAEDVVGTSSYGMSVVETGTNCVLFQYDVGQGGKLAVQPGQRDGEETRTWFSGYHYRGGFQYQRRSGGNLTVVNVVGLEDYVNGVICYEMGRNWPLEALKAQAMCARTYVLRNLGTHESYGFDICNSSYCQVYYGMGIGDSYGPSETSMRAVEETAGLVIQYAGQLAETPYSSSFGGASEDAANIWGTNTQTEYPYLQGVEDPYESYADDINARAHWTVEYTAGELNDRLHSYGYGTNTSLESLELEYSDLGNVIRVTIHWENGQTNSLTSSGSGTIRSVLGVDSIRFTINGQTPEGGSCTRSGDGGYLINGEDTVDDLDGLYVISGTGEVSPLDEDPYVITGTGTRAPLEEGQSSSGASGSGTVTVSGSEYVFEGGGWGHQVGLSQYGANAMAKLGFDYEEIITFYYPGVDIVPYA